MSLNVDSVLTFLAVRTSIFCLVVTAFWTFGQSCSQIGQNYVKSFREPFAIGFSSSTLFAVFMSTRLIDCNHEILSFWNFVLTSFVLVSFLYSYLFCHIRSIYDETSKAFKFARALSFQHFCPSKHATHECCICFEEFGSKEEIAVLACCHYFHSQCVRVWLTRVQSCPLCRQNQV